MEYEVVVVARRATGEQLRIEPFHRLRKHVQALLAIDVIAEDRLAPVTARGDVIDRVGDSRQRGRNMGGAHAREEGRRQDLTPDRGPVR